ncbi:MAG: hypothetical protein JST50_06335 [Bacteroidetes bacterium]|jgi:hypothetical protein|nr:hypothetical protein [Bacteroidota bacterium]
MKYDDYVIRVILANNQFGITTVNDLISIKTLYLVQEEFPFIEKLIQSGDIGAIQNLTQNGIKKDNYLDIMSFTDQNAKKFIVTIYDSDALEQDPQVIEIYSC